MVRVGDVSVALAYVLITAESFDSKLVKDLKKIKGVMEAYPVYGVYDVVVKTYAETMDGLKETHDRIRRMENVRQTLTMIAHEE